MIPDEAVEAAARNLYVSEHGPWDGGSGVTSAHLTRARSALEAAAPHMLAGAPDEKLLRLADDMESAMSGGPEFIGRTGLRFNASERIRRILGVESATF